MCKDVSDKQKIMAVQLFSHARMTIACDLLHRVKRQFTRGMYSAM